MVETKIAETRNKAQAMIMAGQVYINGKKIIKSSELYRIEDIIKIKSLHPKWVSRGALKLLHILNHFNFEIKDYKCLDIGASTGGFTQVLLSKGVDKIYCVDVGKNQLHEKLINNPKVINLPKTNARYLSKEIVKDKINILVCDVSFISLKKVIEPSLKLLEKDAIIIALIKPQFESKKGEIPKGGIIKDDNIHKKICLDVHSWFTEICKMKVLDIIESPIKGAKGNKEFLICAKR